MVCKLGIDAYAWSTDKVGILLGELGYRGCDWVCAGLIRCRMGHRPITKCDIGCRNRRFINSLHCTSYCPASRTQPSRRQKLPSSPSSSSSSLSFVPGHLRPHGGRLRFTSIVTVRLSSLPNCAAKQGANNQRIRQTQEDGNCKHQRNQREAGNNTMEHEKMHTREPEGT